MESINDGFGKIGGESFKREVSDSSGRVGLRPAAEREVSGTGQPTDQPSMAPTSSGRADRHPAAGQHWRAAKNAVILSNQIAVQSDGRGQAAIKHWGAAKGAMKFAGNHQFRYHQHRNHGDTPMQGSYEEVWGHAPPVDDHNSQHEEPEPRKQPVNKKPSHFRAMGHAVMNALPTKAHHQYLESYHEEGEYDEHRELQHQQYLAALDQGVDDQYDHRDIHHYQPHYQAVYDKRQKERNRHFRGGAHAVMVARKMQERSPVEYMPVSDGSNFHPDHQQQVRQHFRAGVDAVKIANNYTKKYSYSNDNDHESVIAELQNQLLEEQQQYQQKILEYENQLNKRTEKEDFDLEKTYSASHDRKEQAIDDAKSLGSVNTSKRSSLNGEGFSAKEDNSIHSKADQIKSNLSRQSSYLPQPPASLPNSFKREVSEMSKANSSALNSQYVSPRQSTIALSSDSMKVDNDENMSVLSESSTKSRSRYQEIFEDKFNNFTKTESNLNIETVKSEVFEDESAFIPAEELTIDETIGSPNSNIYDVSYLFKSKILPLLAEKAKGEGDRPKVLLDGMNDQMQRFIKEVSVIKIQSLVRQFNAKVMTRALKRRRQLKLRIEPLIAFRLCDDILLQTSVAVATEVYNEVNKKGAQEENLTYELDKVIEILIEEFLIKVENESKSVVIDSINEEVKDYTQKKAKLSTNPLVVIVNSLIDEVIEGECSQDDSFIMKNSRSSSNGLAQIVSRLSINECVLEYLLEKQAEYVYDNILGEFLRENNTPTLKLMDDLRERREMIELSFEQEDAKTSSTKLSKKQQNINSIDSSVDSQKNLHLDEDNEVNQEDLLALSHVVSESVYEVYVQTVYDNIVLEYVSSNVENFCANVINSMKAELEEAKDRADKEAIAGIAKEIVGKELLVGHILFQLGNNFEDILIEHYMRGLMRRQISERVVNMIDTVQTHGDRLVGIGTSNIATIDSDGVSRQQDDGLVVRNILLECTAKPIQESLVSAFKYENIAAIQAIDEIERYCGLESVEETVQLLEHPIKMEENWYMDAPEMKYEMPISLISSDIIDPTQVIENEKVSEENNSPGADKLHDEDHADISHSLHASHGANMAKFKAAASIIGIAAASIDHHGNSTPVQLFLDGKETSYKNDDSKVLNGMYINDRTKKRASPTAKEAPISPRVAVKMAEDISEKL